MGDRVRDGNEASGRADEAEASRLIGARAEPLSHVRAPTLLIVGGRDEEVLALNRAAAARMPGEVEVRVVEGAGHLFEEAGTLDAVVALARDWFEARIGRGRGLR